MENKLLLIDKVSNMIHQATGDDIKSLAYLIHKIVVSKDVDNDGLYDEVAKWQITLR